MARGTAGGDGDISNYHTLALKCSASKRPASATRVWPPWWPSPRRRAQVARGAGPRPQPDHRRRLCDDELYALIQARTDILRGYPRGTQRLRPGPRHAQSRILKRCTGLALRLSGNAHTHHSSFVASRITHHPFVVVVVVVVVVVEFLTPEVLNTRP